MALTPIRIRGKKRPSTSDTPRSRGRPSKPASATSTGPSSRASSPVSTASKRSAESTASETRSKRRKTTKNGLPSCLEQLPAELLQTIFLYSMNIALPRSSPNIAAKLSSEHVYMRYSMKLLYLPELWCFHLGERDIDAISKRLVLPDHARMQSELFRCRFFTWEFYKRYAMKAYETWAQGTDEERMYAPCFEDPGSTLDYQGGEPTDEYGIPAFLRLMVGFRIPEKLLHGPWTDDKVAFLYFLVWIPGASIDWESSSAGEIAIEGLYDAIRARSRVAVASLLHQKIGVRPTTDMVRLAVTECGCDRTIVHDLLESDYDGVEHNIDYDNSELWAWVQREKQKGNIKGQWLKGRLRYAADCLDFVDVPDPDEELGEGEDPWELIKMPFSFQYRG